MGSLKFWLPNLDGRSERKHGADWHSASSIQLGLLARSGSLCQAQHYTTWTGWYATILPLRTSSPYQEFKNPGTRLLRARNGQHGLPQGALVLALGAHHGQPDPELARSRRVRAVGADWLKCQDKELGAGLLDELALWQL